MKAMQEAIVKYWQLLIYLASMLVGVGLTLSEIRSSNKRLDRMESHGTSVAQAAARHAEDLERRVVILENSAGAARGLLERIDERTKNIVDRLDRLERMERAK